MGNSVGEVYGFVFSKEVPKETREKYLKGHSIYMVNNAIPGETRVITNLRDYGDRTKPEELEPGVIKMTFIEPEYE